MRALGQLQGVGWPSPPSGGEKGYSLPQKQNSPVERGSRGLREAEPLADGSSWAYRGAGVGFGRQPFKRDVSFEPGRLEGLSRGCHNSHAGEL